MSSNLVHPPGVDWLKHSGTKLSVRMASLKTLRKIITRSLSMYKLWYISLHCCIVGNFKGENFHEFKFQCLPQKLSPQKFNFGCAPPTYDWLAFHESRFSPSKVSRYIMVLLANALCLMKYHNE